MFEFLRHYRVVLVTGPQRSGTRICAHMIAGDARMKYIDETVYGTHYEDRFTNIIKTQSNIVVQCPAMCHIIHKVSAPDVAIIFMLREVSEIIASQERVGWPSEEKELKKYKRKHGIISEVKYSFWLVHQRRKVHNPYEIEYRNLYNHPLWIDRSNRGAFTDTQWRL